MTRLQQDDSDAKGCYACRHVQYPFLARNSDSNIDVIR